MTAAARPPGAPAQDRRGRLARLFGRRRESDGQVVDDGSRPVLARAFDVERGDAVVLTELAAAGGNLAEPLRLRHVFRVADAADVTDLLDALRADGYDVGQPDAERLTATATVLLTPLAAAQARARMTGLTTRYPVEYLGWEALGHGG